MANWPAHEDNCLTTVYSNILLVLGVFMVCYLFISSLASLVTIADSFRSNISRCNLLPGRFPFQGFVWLHSLLLYRWNSSFCRSGNFYEPFTGLKFLSLKCSPAFFYLHNSCILLVLYWISCCMRVRNGFVFGNLALKLVHLIEM